MEKYPKLLGVSKVVKKVETSFLTPIKGEFKDEVDFA